MRRRQLLRLALAVLVLAAGPVAQALAQSVTSERRTMLRPDAGGGTRSAGGPVGPPPWRPTGPPPWRPVGPPPWNPTGRTPLGSVRAHPLAETRGDTVHVLERETAGAGGVMTDVVEERGVEVPVSGSFYCQGHDRGFGGRDTFAVHVEQMHGYALDEVSDVLIVENGVWILPAG